MQDKIAFTIRIPRHLEEQISKRAELQRRTRNAEVNVLLEQAIDEAVGRDIRILKSSGGHSQG